MIAHYRWVKNLMKECIYFPGVGHCNKPQPEYKLGGWLLPLWWHTIPTQPLQNIHRLKAQNFTILLLLLLLYVDPNITTTLVAYYQVRMQNRKEKEDSEFIPAETREK